MAGDRWPRASYPGAISVVSCTYTCSHGITPATAVLRILPQDGLPAGEGNLTLFDGVGTVVIRNCKLDRMKVEMTEQGAVWAIELLDRRWRWRDFGAISGWYNQLNEFGKLIPWTIRSPAELALLCIQAMGETVYSIDLPVGLSYPGPMVTAPIPNISGVNPPFNWDAEMPAHALQSLAEQFGRRVVYDPVTDGLYILRAGAGIQALPVSGYSVAKASPSLNVPEAPDGVGVVGAPTRYQGRFRVDAVGEEWSGEYRPINYLSYAPSLPGQKQKWTCTAVTGTETLGAGYQVTVGTGNPVTQTFIEHTCASGESANTIVSDLATKINANATLSQSVIATASGSGLVIEGRIAGVSFTVVANLSGPATAFEGGSGFTAVLTTPAQPAGRGWDYSPPPLFPGIRATARLTLYQARSLAQKSVFKTFKLSDIDASGQGAPKVPGYGPVFRKEQIYLLPTMVDQIVPESGDSALIDRRGQPFVLNFYNGYSHDQPARVYGSIANFLQDGLNIKNRGANTPEGSIVYLGVSVDPVRFLCTLSNYAYKMGNAGNIEQPRLLLQTAVHVRHPDTNQFICFQKVKPLGGPGNWVAWTKKPDVELNVTSSYNAAGQITGVGLLESDPLVRAQYYLDGASAQYLISSGATAEYNGFYPFSMSGSVQQITWTVEEGTGGTTTVSLNNEHHPYIPPFPARRRAEFLRPANQARMDVANDKGRVQQAEAVRGAGG